jgi:hypothetical protein
VFPASRWLWAFSSEDLRHAKPRSPTQSERGSVSLCDSYLFLLARVTGVNLHYALERGKSCRPTTYSPQLRVNSEWTQTSWHATQLKRPRVISPPSTEQEKGTAHTCIDSGPCRLGYLSTKNSCRDCMQIAFNDREARTRLGRSHPDAGSPIDPFHFF